mmetsp:Transcript_57684/g.167433  ORF Transcript_57684/g.167433 Transcript_57684/m.167433 type:complete len:211 (-) Transcript_57684:377-1009(-)
MRSRSVPTTNNLSVSGGTFTVVLSFGTSAGGTSSSYVHFTSKASSMTFKTLASKYRSFLPYFASTRSFTRKSPGALCSGGSLWPPNAAKVCVCPQNTARGGLASFDGTSMTETGGVQPLCSISVNVSAKRGARSKPKRQARAIPSSSSANKIAPKWVVPSIPSSLTRPSGDRLKLTPDQLAISLKRDRPSASNHSASCLPISSDSSSPVS